MKKVFINLSLSIMLLTASGISTIAQAALPPEAEGKPMNSLSPMLKKIMPAVVNVAAQGEVFVPSYPKRGNPPPEQPPNPEALPQVPFGSMRDFASLGSGVIVNASKGYVLTNAHVIDKAKTITVTLSDGRDFQAKLIGKDTASDIALLQIPAENLTAMPLGDSDKLQVGDFVVAIGNPFGLNQTVTSGIVSALQRSDLGIEGPKGVENFIQTDASINPGNSGGALVNLQGQLIGINTAILAPEGGNIGIGFAIPIDMAQTIMTQLIQYGEIKRGLMGVIVQNLTPDLAKGFNLPASTTGAVVTQVSVNSPAAKSGLKVGDVITWVDGKKVISAAMVRNAVGLLRVGSKVELKVLRGDDRNLTLTLSTEDAERYLDQQKQQNPFLFGLTMQDFDRQSTLEGHIKGVLILNVSKNSAAWRAGLQRGDVILSANEIPVTNISELNAAVVKNKNHLLLNIMRNSGALFVILD